MTPQNQQILQRVADFITTKGLLAPALDNASTDEVRPVVYVGLSGGADSVTLLHILLSLGYSCHALHCNFHLRGAESDRDEQFCRDLCLQLGVPFLVQHFDTFSYMEQKHLSLEMAARELRYDWWKQVINNKVIALGHHQDDSIETTLMNLMRGTGIQGITGIVPKNEATHVIRPLLCLNRSEILAYLADNQLSYVTDSTNLENDTIRNRIRNQLLPLMDQILPHSRQGIVQTIEHLQSTQHFAETLLEQYDYLTRHFNRWGIEWDELSLSDLQKHFPHFAEDYVHYWEQKHSSPGYRICRDTQRIFTAPTDETIYEAYRPELRILTEEKSESFAKTESLVQLFDADTISLPLTLRRYQTGDRMAPIGLNGHTKLLSDLFQNAHYSPMQKATTWLVTDSTGAILWVIGLRISDLHKVSSQTNRCLRLSVE